MNRVRKLPSRRDLLAGAAVGAAALAAPAIVRAQSAPLKVGVLLPRSGFEAGIGQAGLPPCHRSHERGQHGESINIHAAFSSVKTPMVHIGNGMRKV